ncbi:kinesin-like protein KIN-8A [Selaginella moellendorffii]|uniref:kinesin-like protein KIN-8A n=1 Tax=Selaginella moellendorffii TaxID=88036 RepID=UPI000D1C34A1|nr:kinesin-like protein KIN-8A [Selaginella moellendorffii]|eukprot:XP_024532544.1 kinesin-like protein KIN-8A [Selaginella moellendorffii]
MPVTRSQSALGKTPLGCKLSNAAGFVEEKQRNLAPQSVLKENAEPPQENFQNSSQQQPLKTSHASVSLFTPRVMTRSSSRQAQAQVVPMDIEDDSDEISKMLLRCSSKGRIQHESFLACPPPVSSTVVYSTPPPSCGNRNINDRPVLTGIEFGCKKTSSPQGQGESTTPRSGSRRRDLRSHFLRGKCDDPEEVGRIMVYVRLRPLSKKEKDAGARSSVRVADKKDIFLTEMQLETDYLRLKRVRGRHFVFDAVFHENTGQQEVYDTSTADLVEAVLQGKNASVFCYGATGAGKTYTMLGTVSQPGVMVLALKDLFSKLKDRSKDGDYLVSLSYLEVYNETVVDLLSPGRPLIIREDNKGITTAGLTHYQAFSAEEVMLLLQRGNQHRTTEPTRINETSSRSHAILQVTAEYKVRMETSTITRIGKLSLIDLAGSERALATDQRSLRSIEGANINKSLLALSRCIKALVEGDKHVPFRNSKLTQLLKDSLGGACQTAMIANITPSHVSFGETQNTLHWADKAKEIRTKVTAKEELEIPESQEEQTKLLLEMQKQNQQLRLQLASLQQKYIALQFSSVTKDPLQSPVKNPLASPNRFPEYQATALLSPRVNRDAEKTVRELKKAIEMMEKEALRVQRQHRKKEGEMSNSIAALTMQVKQKDDMIKKLSQQKDGRVVATTPRGKAMQSETPRGLATNLPPSGRPAPLTSEQKMKPARKSKLSFATPGVPEPAAAPESPSATKSRFFSPAKAEVTSKKRSFWDLGGSNSPSLADRIRCTRSNSTTPSLLLQPGFTRRRKSDE